MMFIFALKSFFYFLYLILAEQRHLPDDMHENNNQIYNMCSRLKYSLVMKKTLLIVFKCKKSNVCFKM